MEVTLPPPLRPGYSYLFVRFFRTPQKFGITQQDCDPAMEG